MAIQGEAFADDGRVASKIALPEGVAQIRGTDGASRLVVFRSKKPFKDGLESQYTKEVAADPQALRVADFAAGGQIESLAASDSDVGEAFLALTDFFPHGKAQLRVFAGKLLRAPGTVGDADSADGLGMVDRNGTETYGVDEL